MNYRKEIDGLRAISVLAVIFYHAGFQAVNGGFVGVDVFFVISGYVIGAAVIKDLNEGSFNFLKFYERRIRRIFPAFFIVLVLSAVLGWLTLTPEQLNDFFHSFKYAPVFTSNQYFLRNSGYFDPSSSTRPLLHTWSLSVEFQFYLLFPIIFAYTHKKWRKALIPITVTVLVFSLIYSESLLSTLPSTSFFGFPSRIWEILLGVLLVLGEKKFGSQSTSKNQRLTNTLSLSGLFLIAASVFGFHEETPFPGYMATIPVLGASLILVFGKENTLTGKLLGLRFLVFIGTISYSAYLFHHPLFSFFRLNFGQPDAVSISLLLLVLLATSSASLRWIERPCRLQKTQNTKRIIAYGTVSMALLVALGTVGRSSVGYLEQHTTTNQKLLLGTAKPSPKRSECHTGGRDFKNPNNACAYLKSDAKWAVLGDSHGVELAYGLALNLEANGLGLRHFTFSSCPPSFGNTASVPVRSSDCQRWTELAVKEILSDSTIQTVVIAYRLNSHLFGSHTKLFPKIPKEVSDNVRQERWVSLGLLTQTLKLGGKRVIVVLQSPELPTDIENMIYRAPYLENSILGVTRAWWNQRSQWVSSHTNELTYDALIDPAEFLCDSENCYAARNGVSYYFDDNHPSVSGAVLIADHITNQHK